MLNNRYKKLSFGVGATTIVGFIVYDVYRFKRRLSSLLDTNALDIDKKRPDYIYIKYHIYRESMEKMKEMNAENKKWLNVMLHPFGKWWKSMKHSVAWRLLKLAQHGNQFDRLKAVRQLAMIDHLKDWDFQHLAQLCDARTAVSLARCECDQRWFLSPRLHGVLRNPKTLVRDIIISLEKLKPNQCVSFYLNKLFFNYKLKNLESSEYYLPVGKKISKQDLELFKQCIDMFYHITADPELARQFGVAGGLQLILELMKIFSENDDVKSVLAKIVAHLSLISDLTEDFFVTGWVGILARWTQTNDFRVSAIAAKALANLDKEDPFNSDFVYRPKIYPLYPKFRVKQRPEIDVIFIHGLLGGVFITWRQKDKKAKELGLYGKNSSYDTEPTCVDDIQNMNHVQHAIDTYTNDSNDNNNNIDNNANNKNLLNNEIVIKKSLTNVETVKSTNAPKKKERRILSDIATKEFMESLQALNDLDSDWEVVYPDCPIKSNNESTGPYSISGDQWNFDDENDEEYTNCWPMDWLPNNFPSIRVIGVNYETSLTVQPSCCPCGKSFGKINSRAADLLERLVDSGVGNDRPIIWVGHSMGGLLTKSIIIQAMQSTDPKVKKIGTNTRAVLFLGTPHKGSSIKMKDRLQAILSPSSEVIELEENAPGLLELDEAFIKHMNFCDNKIKLVSIAEGMPTMLTSFKFPFRVVSEDSAQINMGDFYILNDDHLGLCKPIYRQSFLYQRLIRLINQILTEPSFAVETVSKTSQVPENVNNLAKLMPIQEPKENLDKTNFS